MGGLKRVEKLTGENTPLLRSRVNSLREGEGAVPGFPRTGTRRSVRFSLRSEAAISLCEPSGPDGGWGWVVVLSSFICLCILDGSSYTFGVFLDPLLVEMGGGRAKMSVAGSLLVATYAFTGPVAAKLTGKFGTRAVCVAGAFISALGLGLGSLSKSLGHILATYSIITGVGFGLMYIPSIVAVANHFTKNRSIAISLCLCGAGVGTFALSPLEMFITSNYGWRWGFISLSILCLFCTLCGMTMTPVESDAWTSIQPEDHDQSRNEQRIKTVDKILGLVLDPALYHSPSFFIYLIVVLADLLATTSLFIPFQYLPAVVLESGLDKSQAAYIISATGICSTFGRILAGLAADHSLGHPLSLITISISLVCPAMFLLLVCKSFWTFLICAGLFGLLTGGWIALMSPLFVRILGLDLLTPAFGLMTGVRGVAALIGPPMAGLAVDYFTDRKAAIILGGCVMSGAAILFFLANIYSARRENKAGLHNEEENYLRL